MKPVKNTLQIFKYYLDKIPSEVNIDLKKYFSEGWDLTLDSTSGNGAIFSDKECGGRLYVQLFKEER